MHENFYGRERELSILQEALDSNVARLIVLRGRRRIGKSRLAEKFGEKFERHLTFVGLPPEDGVTDEIQRRHFANDLERQSGQYNIRFDDWDLLFSNLGRIVQKGRILIVFDEINWMGSLDPAFLGKLKTAWDLYFKKNPQLVLLLSGSMSAWIEKHILRSTGFFGRIAIDMVLKELPLHQCVHFWGSYEKNISSLEKFKILSITGGIPLYLEAINPKISAEENIRRLCFRPEGLLFVEFERIFSDVFGSRAPNYKKIVTSMLQGTKEQVKLFSELEIEKSGVYSEYLDELVKTGYLARDFTWKINSGNISKLSHYRLCDNYLRFYLQFIEPNKHNILQDRNQLPFGWKSIMGLQFENLVLNNRHKLHDLLHIRPSEILIDNPYFQKPTKQKRGVQIDYMVQTRFNVIYVCEIKFYKEKVGVDVIKEFKAKIQSLSLPKGFSIHPVLIHVNGVTDELKDEGFFSYIVDFAEFLKPLKSP